MTTTTLERPAESAGALYVKTPVTPEEIFQAIGRLRKEARDEIDRLIRFLDSTENHMAIDCEPEDEGDDCELEDGADDEPSLGSHEVREAGAVSYVARAVCAVGEAYQDCELDDSDFEPSLAGGGYSRFTDDREVDGAESGIGDLDGLLEQVGSQDWQQVWMA